MASSAEQQRDDYLSRWEIDQDFKDYDSFLEVNNKVFVGAAQTVALCLREQAIRGLTTDQLKVLINVAAWVRVVGERVEELAAALARAHDGLSWGEIANLTGRPRSTVSSANGRIAQAATREIRAEAGQR